MKAVPSYRHPSFSFMRRGAGLALFALFVLAGSVAWGAGAPAGAGPSAMEGAAILGALGISPFFALGGLGLADQLGIYEMPAGLGAFAHPVVLLLLVLLGFGLHAGRSAKLTKPLAEAAGVGESVFALVCALALAIPHFGSAGGPVQAGVLEGALLLAAAGSAVAALIVLRTALDVMIWLSPFPFVDAGFQAVKLGATVLLLVAAIIAPPVAIALNAILLIATFVFVRWAVRAARFGLTIAWDLTLGRRNPAVLPRDEVIDGDLGPFNGFALEAPGLARRAPATVDLRAGRWFLVDAGPGGPTGPDTPLGDGTQAILTPTWAGLELSVGGATVLLPPRYAKLAEDIRRESQATLGERARMIPRFPSAQLRSPFDRGLTAAVENTHER